MLLLSIRPRWVDLMRAGAKTAELRRSVPRVECGELIAVYTTRPRAAIETLLLIEGVDEGAAPLLWERVGVRAGCDRDVALSYWGERGVALLIAEARLVRPVTLAEVREHLPEWMPPQSWVRCPEPLIALLSR